MAGDFGEVWLTTGDVRPGDLFAFRRGAASLSVAWRPVAAVHTKPYGETWFIFESGHICRYRTGQTLKVRRPAVGVQE